LHDAGLLLDDAAGSLYEERRDVHAQVAARDRGEDVRRAAGAHPQIEHVDVSPAPSEPPQEDDLGWLEVDPAVRLDVAGVRREHLLLARGPRDGHGAFEPNR